MLLAYACHTFIFRFSKGTKIEFDSMVMILEDPRAPASFDIYKTIERHTK
ncbi:putative spermidine synthase 2 [Gossypium arboreum]|uniref:Putative spermidine synthase 2 n=1 Tax=Gossypium arboreum TaxID=29729 RepID=A0A0B0PZ91_GOSAR|nr:putative spermidine synthase 2 [Gossypium arboreum]